MNANFFASHEQNEKLVEQATQLANEKKVVLCHNASSFAKFDGQHRYLILKNGTTNLTIRSRDLIDYWETRYSRMGQPSIRGERGCLYAVINKLQSM